MKNIYLIRHGETDNNRNGIIQGRHVDAPINELGKRQAKAVCTALEKHPVDKIVASSLVRTHETASPLAERFKLEIIKYPELDEMDFGEHENKHFSDVETVFMEMQEKWKKGYVNHAFRGGESPKDVYFRANTKVQEILSTQTAQHLVFVLHGRLIRVLLSEWLGFGLPNMHRIAHQNGAINHLTWDGKKFKALKLNMTEHLLAKANL